jgi:hypothetical protein
MQRLVRVECAISRICARTLEHQFAGLGTIVHNRALQILAITADRLRARCC